MNIATQTIRFSVNGAPVTVHAAPISRLADVLRLELGLTGTKVGCNAGDCGACTVLLDGEPVVSCLVLAVECEGRTLETVEGLADHGRLAPLQQAFLEGAALQCGICTPGFLMSAKALLKENPQPTEEQIRFYLAGNLCRCTGYDKIVRAVQSAADWKIADAKS